MKRTGTCLEGLWFGWSAGLEGDKQEGSWGLGRGGAPEGQESESIRRKARQEERGAG